MKSRKTWLHTAVRAHQAKTLDHLQRTRHAWDELFEAEQLRDSAMGDLKSLRQDWANRRHAAASSREIDAVYLRFHGFLSDEAVKAEHAQQACREQVDAAVAELKQSHAVQRTLEKIARQSAEQLRRSARATELQSNAEAWLLGRIAGGAAHAERNGAAGESFDVVDGKKRKASLSEG
ncbi:hypothetical protein [Roseateles sp. P5_E1]